MSAKNDQDSSSDSMSRKERRAADRASRKNRRGSAGNSKSSGSSGPSMFLISIGAVLIGLVAVGALIVVSGGFDSDEVAAISMPVAAAAPAELRDGRSLQKPGVEPPVIIDAYEDPQCPACGLFTDSIEPLLIAGPVRDGTVRFTYNDFAFLGPESFDAAAAMHVAEEMDGKFWDYHDVLFHNQSGENQGAFTLERLADIAETVGLDRDVFLAEMDDSKYLAAVEAETAEGRGLSVNSTPTLIINGALMPGVPTWDDLEAAIEDAAALAQTAG
jgi:protein-disulfide isomerase